MYGFERIQIVPLLIASPGLQVFSFNLINIRIVDKKPNYIYMHFMLNVMIVHTVIEIYYDCDKASGLEQMI